MYSSNHPRPCQGVRIFHTSVLVLGAWHTYKGCTWCSQQAHSVFLTLSLLNHHLLGSILSVFFFHLFECFIFLAIPKNKSYITEPFYSHDSGGIFSLYMNNIVETQKCWMYINTFFPFKIKQ